MFLDQCDEVSGGKSRQRRFAKMRTATGDVIGRACADVGEVATMFSPRRMGNCAVALARSIDREAMNNVLLQGGGEPAGTR